MCSSDGPSGFLFGSSDPADIKRNSRGGADLDFSSFAGVYVNSEGMIIVLDEEDIERKLMEVMCIDDGHYYLNVKTDDGFGYGIEVYGIGVEVPEYEGLTDITKIRVYRGQAGPMSVEEIFNKQK